MQGSATLSGGTCPADSVRNRDPVFGHPVSVRRFPFFRTQPLENLTPLPMNKRISEQPSPCRKYYKRESCYGDRV